ncbi:MAG TPA: thioredoxin domain-containing protein [Thermoanaerobaculia bacterium]|nr:thioredoxin domain-containing protein [Thermoanaerobaculia bacterium]
MNRLANETSPYLLQHAHNPVDWYPWGTEAWEKARADDRPVFLSIGYSACHWCHVMERESFEDPEIAAILNEHFVAIKVDREERPDVDSIYMQAVQMMTGHGGWPMSMFLTPEGKPFFAGTYFPPAERHGMPSFRRVLEHVASLYRTRREDVEEASNEVHHALSSQLRTRRESEVSLDHRALWSAALRMASSYDARNGGFGGAPKFPPSMSLEFLMMVAHRTGDARLREIVAGTLTKMAHGGIYDQVGGGFHRYSVDERWLVPHFEKMLYDNALLARLYTRAWQWTKDPLFARITKEILGFVEREMTSPDGAFYATLDADSEGEEGKFYVWTRKEVLDLLGEEEGPVFCALYDITERGNWEGHNILNMPRPMESVAADLGLTIDQLADIAARGKCKLYGVRSQRVWPGRDEKLLTGWNGWMLAAFAEAAIAFDRYHDVVRRNADFLLARIDSTGRLTRHAKIPGLLEDYSGAAWGLLLAWEATHARKYLDAARTLADAILDRFSDAENGGFYDTPVDHEKLITRPKDLFDNATPAGTSVTCDVLLRLAVLFGEEAYARAASEALEGVWPLAEKYPSGFGFLSGVAEWRASQPKEIALTGDFAALKRVVGETYVPHRLLVAGAESADLPLMQQRPLDRTLAYVCSGYVCKEPTDDPARLRELLLSLESGTFA